MAKQEPAPPQGRTRGGGPRTAAGKSVSRRNALTHGLAAKTLLPEILTRDLVALHYRKLREEYQPATPTEEHFVREMARHAAALDGVEEMEKSVLRRGARGALELFSLEASQPGPEHDDAALAGAGTSDAIERLGRYRRAHERAFLRSWEALRDAQGSAPRAPGGVLSPTCAAAPASMPSPPPGTTGVRFQTEAECEHYLRARWDSAAARCPACDGRAGGWIASRQLWQCATCRHQSGLRAATVMVGSRLPLRAWFQLIEALLASPSASATELMERTGLTRAATVRSAARRIREALSSAQRSDRLAGLDAAFASGPGPAESSGARKAFLTERTATPRTRKKGAKMRKQ